MTTRLTRLCRTALGAALLLGGAALAPAASAALAPSPARWVFSADILQAVGTWTSHGTVTGLLGNAHSGSVYLDTDESGGLLQQNDWNCPAGVTPPISEVEPTACSLLRYRYVYGGTPVFTGPLSYRISGPTSVETYAYEGADPVVTTGHIDLAFRRTGPVSSSTTISDGLKIVQLSAPMKMTGYIGATSFADPRLSQAVDPYTHTIYFVQG